MNLKTKMIQMLKTLHNCLPASKKSLQIESNAFLAILDAHEEFQMINRKDIITLAENMMERKTEPITEKKEDDVMYG